MKKTVMHCLAFCTDFLTKKFVPNTGQIPQYYVEGDHKAIIEPEIFEQVQKMMASRHREKNCYSGIHLFSGKIRCSQCGGWYGSKVWHSNDKYCRVIWKCNHKFESQKCTTPHLSEEAIKEKFIISVNQLLTEKKQAVKDFTAARDTVFDISALGFTDDMWLSLTDYVTVYDKNDIRFTFKNGTEI